jgi:phosphoribosylaminoimidazolecarboxamide formyltransferase/IMP cyclohydrolase
MSKPLALLSATDKTDLDSFGRGLVELGFELVSTGGTAAELRRAGLEVLDVANLTGFPEMLDGRVKTLHPMVHGGLLGDLRNEAHASALARAGIRPIAVVAVNLYAFEATVSRPHGLEDAIESIDIGGPAMIRSAAKNSANVAVVVDPGDYAAVLKALADGSISFLRTKLAAKAFRHTAFYDSVIARYLSEAVGEDALAVEKLTLGFRRRSGFRYGENPHQEAALYEDPLAAARDQLGIVQASQLWGKELSYNNLGDGDAAWELVADLPPGSCAIIKHGNPCGAALGENLGESYRLARRSDPISAFGGIAAFHGTVDATAAEAMIEKGNFLEVVIAEGYEPAALELMQGRSGWGQDVRLLAAPLPPAKAGLSLRTLRGGAIAQTSDDDPGTPWQIVTQRAPNEAEMAALRFQWAIVPHVKSNAIVVGTGDRLLGVGAGQMNRVQSVRLALDQAGPGADGAVLASDAFFPFPDSIETAAAAGITAIVQPGGSKKDEDVIAAADRLGLAMAFTGVRHFRH